MSESHLEVTVRHQGRIAVLDLRGQIDGFAGDTLDTAYARAEGPSPEAIVLNFSRVSYINSTGIALIIEVLAKARAGGRQLLAYGLSDHFVQIFQITRLSDFVRIVEGEERAMAEVGQLTS